MHVVTVRCVGCGDSTEVGRGKLRTRAQAPELDEAFGGKTVSRKQVDEWLGGMGSEDEHEEEDEEEEEEQEEEAARPGLKTKTAMEAEKLHRELMDADKQAPRKPSK